MPCHLDQKAKAWVCRLERLSKILVVRYRKEVTVGARIAESEGNALEAVHRVDKAPELFVAHQARSGSEGNGEAAKLTVEFRLYLNNLP